MGSNDSNNQRKTKELLYQIVVHLLVFTTYAVTRRETSITPFEIVSFANYAVTAFFINYFVLPRYYKNKKTFQLLLIIIFSLFACILIEEVVLEPIFFPADRGANVKLFWTIITVLPRLSLLVVFKLAWDMIFIRRELEKVKSIAEQNELHFLQTQINPHFLFNNLNNIYSFALEGSPKTPEIILGLSDMMRYVLYECKEDYMLLTKELKQLENFIKLNELQIEDRGQVTFESTGENERYKIAPLILIVFVENAFKHSVSSLSEGIYISIKTKITSDNKLLFTCENNYSESTNTDSLSHGIGLENVHKRLELIYGDNYELDYSAENSKYIVTLKMPLIELK